MKKTAQIRLGLLASLAVTLSSCRSHPVEMKRCVDKDDFVVDDQNCESANQNSLYRYHWYYGGSGAYAPGSSVSGGSYSPHAGFTPVTSSESASHFGTSSVTRGGFGAGGAHMSTTS